MTAGPSGLKIETARNAIDIETFTGEVKTGNFSTFHSSKVNFLQAHTSAGHEFLFVRGLALNLETSRNELGGQGVTMFARKLRPLGFVGNVRS